MEYKGESCISVRFKQEDFMELGITNNSGANKWNKEIDIFDDRIKERFLNQIQTMYNYNDLKRYGFV
ncbi:Uncharacterised protein [[Clostridium] sordellii]|uniref:hypothetical protein n=1 Tax=Paraclostridium sordellii TaxID=1505 RepID=UPI0005E80076|nr:hypothetical protein [Paeniclostridium sordellii]MDU4412758.1 hypothetical protein [Paeniclostridium sordellii]MRZ29366.1 hypothetical protein [Paeniclostridium sordellii]CEO35529.1 Uncharacterised protein [[Clostridium] sordellii] [Paeniclostridium sordellii]CEP92742.1 Uncharacterised protein [[Clostridium] sordellii] [Paeniclostridium sordellii]